MSQSSLSTIANLQVWLDGRDYNYFTTNEFPTPSTFDVLQWRDKSSNAYIFNPLIPTLRPVLSTNAVRFSMGSSFQLVSQQKIPGYSTIDLFMILTPDNIRGPRQPFFDSTDFTLAETDTRINTQVYADGGEFFRPSQTPNYTQSFQIYKGDLYAGTNVGQVPNFIQRYDKISRSFGYVREWPLSTGSTRGLSVYDGKLFTASDSRCEWFNGSTAFVSTNYVSSAVYCPIVYKGDLYTICAGRVWTSATASQRPQLYKFNSNTGNMVFLTETHPWQNANNWGIYFSNAINFRDDLFFTSADDGGNHFFTRWNGTFYNSNSIANVPNPPSIYMGNLILPRNDIRMWKWNENLNFNIGRQIIFQSVLNGGIAYKGNLILSRAMNFNNQNVNNFEIYTGEQGGPYSNAINSQLTTNNVPINMPAAAIIYDGRLFMNWNSSSQVIEFGNGIGMDQPFSRSAPLLLTIRKSPILTQLWLNGTMVEQEFVNFTYSNQPAREMHVGGAVGTMSHGMSDPGHDHLTGSIHTLAQYTSNLSQSDRQRVEGILAWNYGIESVLPSDHPFKNAAP